jgi:ESX secretion system ATPase EccB
MQTRKDLLQAHRLMTQRAGLALVQGQPDTSEQPLRRMNVATFAGVMIAALVGAVFGIIGAITHTGGQLKPGASGVVIMDKDTGTAYIWCGNRGHQLCPAVNYASARLAASLSGNGVTVQSVSQGALTRYPHGQQIGIQGLPPVPLASNLITGPWSVCVATVSAGTSQQQVVTLVAGRRVGGQALTADKAVLVQAQAGRTWLIWNGKRLPVEQNIAALLPGTQQTGQVTAQWLNALPKGAAFAPPRIPGAGATTADGPNGTATIGQVYKVDTGSGIEWFVQLAGGVARISGTDAFLLGTANPSVSTVSPQQVSSHLMNGARVDDGGLPQTPPQVVQFQPSAPLCAVYATGRAGPAADQVSRGGRVPDGALQAVGAVAPGSASVDKLWLPPNKGALIGVDTGGGRQSATTYFLVEGGTRYALQSRGVAADLGYRTGADSVLVPVNVADLIPTGPVLSPANAALPVQQPAGG